MKKRCLSTQKYAILFSEIGHIHAHICHHMIAVDYPLNSTKWDTHFNTKKHLLEMQKGFIGYLNSNRYKIQSKTAGKRQQRKKMSGRSKQTKLNKQKPTCGLVVVVCACIAVPRTGPIGFVFSLTLSLSKDA